MKQVRPTLTPEQFWVELSRRVDELRALQQEELSAADFDDRVGIRIRRDQAQCWLGRWVAEEAPRLDVAGVPFLRDQVNP